LPFLHRFLFLIVVWIFALKALLEQRCDRF
jgi:hypothetical protein